MTSRASMTLPNGLRLISVKMPHLHSAELALYLKVGGRNDPPGKGGLAHFLEHMLFRGTADYPTSTEIETAFEAIGGSINASTDEECTCFFSRIHPAHIRKGVEILSSMVLRPLLTDLEIEKKIITEEALDDLSEKGEEINPHNLASRLLWPSHQLGEPTIGTLESIESFTLDDLHKHLSRYYLPGNAILVVAGNVDREEFFSAAGTCFGSWKAGAPPPLVSPVVNQQRPESVFVLDSDSQSHLQISFRSVARFDPRIMSLRILRRILCGGGCSRLHLNLRERLGIVYSVDANIAAYEECGYFSIELSTAAENLATAVHEVLAETFKLARVPVELSELNRIRESYFYELDFSRDSCYEMQIRFGWGELMGVVREIEEDMADAGKVTPESLLEVARDLFDPKNVNLVVVGSWQDKDRIAVLNELEKYGSLW